MLVLLWLLLLRRISRLQIRRVGRGSASTGGHFGGERHDVIVGMDEDATKDRKEEC